MNKVLKYLNQPVILMITAIVLWMLYPPVINHLLNKNSVLYVSAFSHTIGGISASLIAFYILFIKDKVDFRAIVSNTHFKKVVLFTSLAGSFSVANHFLLYTALKISDEFDVMAILAFETWPIIFFIIDSKLRKEKRETSINDYVFTAAAFSGFIVLTMPNLDLADFILFDSPMLITIFLALLGGLAMAITCYFRMKNMDYWGEISKEYSKKHGSINVFKQGLLTEAGARTFSGVTLGIILFFSNESIPLPSGQTMALFLFVGVFILAIGGILYDLSVFSSKNASIGALWYLMPVGAIAILAIMQGRWPNQYEAVASVLIVSSNIFLALRYPLRSALLFLFVSVCAVGLYILFMPTMQIDNYYDLLAVSTIFFVLLATFSLERATQLNNERKQLIIDFNEKIISYLEIFCKAGTCEIKNIKDYTLFAFQNFINKFENIKDFNKTQQNIKALKHSLLTKQDTNNKEALSEIFSIGDQLNTIKINKISVDEFIILIFLGVTNIVFSLFFRPHTLASGLFALITTTAIIYLLLVIYERNQNTQTKSYEALNIQKIMQYMHKLEDLTKLDELKQAITQSNSANLYPDRSRASSYWTFSVFIILFVGFGYGFFYDSLEQKKTSENSPLSLNANKKEVKIALLDWTSAKLKANILTKIINSYTDLHASMVPISSKQAFEQMDKKDGGVDIYPELWVQNSQKLIKRYVRAFKTVSLSKTSTEAFQGICYTNFKKENNSSLNMKDLLSKNIAKKFDLSGDSRGNIWIGADSWYSTSLEKKRLSAYGLDKSYSFDVYDYKVFKMLLKRNEKKHIPTLFFCYYPSDLFSNQNIYFVDEKSYNKQEWDTLVNNKHINLAKSGTPWPKNKITIAYKSKITYKQKKLKLLLDNFHIENKELIGMLLRLQKGESVDKISDIWLEENKEKILQWLVGFQLKEQ